ncbi:MAG TPA: (d)CMP kinase [Candidatus Saccharimonadales bacterium]|nr:(d)CMP kinase [Candidatus Saccharimonadales bacterium]
MNPKNIVIAIDGTSASGKSTNAKLVAEALGFIYVDTGAMYRTLAWYCVVEQVDVHDPKAVAALCRKWKTSLECVDRKVRLLVDGYYPDKEIRTVPVTEAVSHVAAVPKVREWMKQKQRECAKFGNLVMEGRDIGTNVFPETDYKFYLDASLDERAKRRAAEGIQENLAARDRRDSQRAADPLMIALGATVINNSCMTPEETSGLILENVRQRLASASSGGPRR